MRTLGLAMVSIGAFLLVLAPMARFYAYPQLAGAPEAPDITVTLVGEEATILDPSSLEEVQTDLTTTVRTSGDPEAAEAGPDGTVVWTFTSQTASSDGVVRSARVERVAFDEHSGEPVNCCGEFLSESADVGIPVEHVGLFAKFPLETRRKDYEFWDSTLREAVPIQYEGTEEVGGLGTYKFEHTIESTKTGAQRVPGRLVGEGGRGTVPVDSMYATTRTVWVEPGTGTIIKRSEATRRTLDHEGESRITVLDVTRAYDDDTVQENVERVMTLGRQLDLLRTVVPLGGVLLGVPLLVGGFALWARRR